MGDGVEEKKQQGETLWLAEDVATYLQMKKSWVYEKAKAGLLPCLRLPHSNAVRFEPEPRP